jgi:hypothetical protein
MPCNESTTDRVVRVVLGLVLLVLGWGGFVTGTVGTVFKWLGFLPLLTGLTGFCLLYAMIGYNGCKRREA